MRNTEETIRTLDCLGIKEWPSEYELINVKYNGNFGTVELWEERKIAGPPFISSPREVFSPYLKAWIFPPREIIKQFMKEDIAEGRMGPEGETQGAGPSQKEVEEAKANPEVAAKIKRIADMFGGSADFLIKVVDGTETVFNIALTINPDVIMQIKPTIEYTGTPDVTLELDFGLLYSIIEATEKDAKKGEMEVPPWETKPLFYGFAEKVGAGFKIFTSVLGSALTGKIKITPITAIPALLFSLGDIMSMIMAGPGGAGAPAG